MSFQQMRDVSEALLTSMTEEEFARWRCKEGANVVFHRGCYWEERRFGFYQPIHLLARLQIQQVTRPLQFCWGFLASLCEDDAVSANGAIPIHLLSNVEDYNLYSVNKNSRQNIRKNRHLFNIVELTDTQLLQEQGYDVFLSATTRTQWKSSLSREKYMVNLVDYVLPKRRLIIAGISDRKLCGYITGYAINGTAYGEDLYITTEASEYNLNRILVFEFVQVCRRSGGIYEFAIGQHWREKPGIVEFKEGMGFPIVYIPAKVQINPAVEQFIRWKYPHKYYRLTGHD
ncbi:MAG: hypothetical protein RMY28_036875 [Nostoc sp. ChiSLP01]|nr:hypothetical protein [Nostoc sp. CmiSLP01]MDZ8282748.1 hypothetical protein [Nostoc sp. ChiSLP01]